MKGSVYNLTHMEFLGHYRPEEEEVAVCVDVVMSLPDPIGTFSLLNQTQRHLIFAHKKYFWATISLVRKLGGFF